MSERLTFAIDEWLENDSLGDAIEAATMCRLRILVDDVSLTEVEDRRASTIRPYIRVPASALATWLIANWWRLRFETKVDFYSFAWLEAHSLAAISNDIAWPQIELSSDGDWIRVHATQRARADASPIEYVRTGTFVVPAGDFEAAVERFVEKVLDRLSARLPDERELHELWDEFVNERGDQLLAKRFRLEAASGFDPSEMPFYEDARKLEKDYGPAALFEVLATTTGVRAHFDEAIRDVESIRSSTLTIDVGAFTQVNDPTRPIEQPWERGVRLAAKARRAMGKGPGPIQNAELTQILGEDCFRRDRAIHAGRVRGAARGEVDQSHIRLVIPSTRETAIRFYLARLMGQAIVTPSEPVLPVTDAGTSMQQLQRSFAQEFLCPFQELERFVARHGSSERAISRVAEEYDVSEWTVISALVNRGVLSRDRLPGPLGGPSF